MNCMKCGRETVNDQVFCVECLAEMENYPVKPGTVVHLPRRREETSAKKSHSRRKAQPAPEEQVKTLRKLLRVLLIALLVSTVLLVFTGYFSVIHLMENDSVFLPGQNYSSATSSDATIPE